MHFNEVYLKNVIFDIEVIEEESFIDFNEEQFIKALDSIIETKFGISIS